ncbi:MAG: ATP-binding protein [Candidatus Eisenbacteria bacterium]
MINRTNAQLLEENEKLRLRLEEAQDTLRALGAGEVDAVLVDHEYERVYVLEAADTPYRLVVEQMPQAGATLTVEGIILHGNIRFAGMLGHPLHSLAGKSMGDFLAPGSRASFETMLRGAVESEVRGEVALQRGDGASAPVYLGISPLREGALGMCLVLTDLTEQRHYVELQAAQAALRESDRRKDEFLAILAHELRTPLGPVRNAAYFLKLNGPLDPEFRRLIEMIERQAGQLARLIDDLLDVSRISRGALELRRERVGLSEIVDSAVDACRDQIRDRGHSFRVSLPPEPTELDADRARLIQVLCNLLTNASKYTPEGGRIELGATATGNVLTLSVKDNGSGIPPQKLAEIFELFVQVDRSDEREGGLGIGLTLVRQLAKLHGGSVEARSAGTGQGSEFILTLPVILAPSASEAVKKGSETPPEYPRRRILVADDNKDAVESLALLLQIAGHEVHRVFDGEAAITSAQDVRPDVALLDIGMPRVNGYDVARRIREFPWGRQMYLVALTGWGQDEDRHRAQAAGFDAHFVKPVDPDAVLRLLGSIATSPPEPTLQ